MNLRQVSVLFLLALFLPLPAVLAQPASSSWYYAENLDLFALGDNALWKMTFSGGNVTLKELAGVEAQATEVSGYSIFAASYSSWTVEYEFLSKTVFNQFLGDMIPSNGMFLKVTASSPSAASNFDNTIDSILYSTFIEYSSSDSDYVFYSHADFENLVKNHLWAAVPVRLGGMSTLIGLNTFLSNDIPMILFEGRKSGDTYTHILTLSGLTPFKVTNKEFRLTSVMQSIVGINASLSSNSTNISIKFVGSLISSSNGTVFTNNYGNLSSSITTQIQAGKPLPKINATVERDFPSLMAVRRMDRGSLNLGDTAEVTVKLQNLGPSGAPPIENLTLNEDWWGNYFDKVEGNSSIYISRLASGEIKSFAYVLRVKEGRPTEISQSTDENQISYSYKVGEDVIAGKSSLNQLHLHLNEPGPALSIIASTSTRKPSIDDASLTLDIENFGGRAAFNLEVYVDEKLVSRNESLISGATWTVKSNITSTNLKETEKTLTSYVKWDEEGVTKVIYGNDYNLFYNFSKPSIATLSISKKVTTVDQVGNTYLYVQIRVNNTGVKDASKIDLIEQLPEGLAYSNGSFTSDGKRLKTTLQQIRAGSSQAVQYYAEVETPLENYVFMPTVASMQLKNDTVSYLSNSYVVPLAIQVEKIITPASGFPGMEVNVVIRALNKGRFPVFNATLQTGSDSFLVLKDGDTSTVSGDLNTGEQLVINYSAILKTAGRYGVGRATLTFTFSDTVQKTNSPQSSIEIYQPVKAELSVSPSEPIEEEAFDLRLNVTNPSRVSVSDVLVGISLPEELQILEGIDHSGLNSIYVGELGSNESKVFTMKIKSSTGSDLLMNSNITFTYGEQNLEGEAGAIIVEVSDNVLMRYGLPTFIGASIAVATIVLLRKVSSTY